MLLCLTACVTPPGDKNDFTQGTGGFNAAHQLNKPYLILVSIDGFRWDYMDRYPTPNMNRIAAAGSKAERLIPVFPTLTFPNHYTIATGLYPSHHGLVANYFPDRALNKWYSLKDRESVENRWFYSGEPIWVTAETQGMVAAAYYFVGTEAAVNGVPPTHWNSYDKNVSGEARVDQVLTWLAAPEETRPHMYTLYFEDVDDHSHWYGPDSPENIAAISTVDGYIGRLLDGLGTTPHANQVNIILLSDHGQGKYHQNPQAFIVDEYVDISGATIIEGGSHLAIHFDQDTPGRAEDIVRTVNQNWKHGRAYTPTGTPGQWQVDTNPRFPDVIMVPNPGFAVLSTANQAHRINKGDHGWAPEWSDMHGFFVASGPDIKAGVPLGAVYNVDIYPLMVSILGLEPPDNLDGDANNLAKLLISD
jgi:predicted AlkP superfamily pyrophosphatase or phosphodiesterase